MKIVGRYADADDQHNGDELGPKLRDLGQQCHIQQSADNGGGRVQFGVKDERARPRQHVADDTPETAGDGAQGDGDARAHAGAEPHLDAHYGKEAQARRIEEENPALDLPEAAVEQQGEGEAGQGRPDGQGVGEPADGRIADEQVTDGAAPDGGDKSQHQDAEQVVVAAHRRHGA